MPVYSTIADDLRRERYRLLNRIYLLVQTKTKNVEELATRTAPQFVTIDSRFERNDDYMEGEVGVFGEDETSNIAAYFEFGTGLSAVEILAPYPDWVKDIAWQFYVNGQGTLKGKPYLFNHFLVIEKELKEELKQIFDEYAD